MNIFRPLCAVISINDPDRIFAIRRHEFFRLALQDHRSVGEKGDGSLPLFLVSLVSKTMCSRLLSTCTVLIFLACVCGCNVQEAVHRFPDCGKQVLDGYTDKVSYWPGETMQFYLMADHSAQCGLEIYDWSGHRSFWVNIDLREQITQEQEPWRTGFNYHLTGKVVIPGNLKSGIYTIEHLVRFVVKSHEPSDVTVIYPSNTIAAYDNAGGKSLYTSNSQDTVPTSGVSFHRPAHETGQYSYVDGALSFFPTLSGVRFDYIADVDMDDYASIHGKIILVAGHSEYWTRKARENFDAFVNSGGHAIVLSGNTMWWQVRYNDAKDELICYKNILTDPVSDPLLITSYWTDPRLNYSPLVSIGADFDHGGYGLQLDQGWDGFRIVSPGSPLLEGTNPHKGDTLDLPTGEYDGAPIAGFDADGYPQLLNDQHFEKLELVGYDRGTRHHQETIGTFIVFQKTKTSGVMVNTGSNTWCSAYSMNNPISGEKIRRITENAIRKLMSDQSVFSF